VPGAASAGARDIPLGVRRRARRLAWVYLIVAVGLVVWTVFSLYVAHRVGRRVRERAYPGHVTGPHPPVPDRPEAHPVPPAGSSAPAELPPEK